MSQPLAEVPEITSMSQNGKLLHPHRSHKCPPWGNKQTHAPFWEAITLPKQSKIIGYQTNPSPLHV